MEHGFYWVERFKNDNPSIALLTKNSGWLFFGCEYHKLIKKVGYTHPYKILKKVKEYDE